jgi:hypothetical protein
LPHELAFIRPVEMAATDGAALASSQRQGEWMAASTTIDAQIEGELQRFARAGTKELGTPKGTALPPEASRGWERGTEGLPGVRRISGFPIYAH